MAALLLCITTTLCATAFGRAAVSRILPGDLGALQRLLTATAVGMGVTAYLLLGMGLASLLMPAAFIVLFVLLAVLGRSGFRLIAEDIRAAALEHKAGLPRTARLAAGFVLAVIALVVCINCFVPPGAREWDALSYHLAAPKVYLQQGRIQLLPTDHHSNFPFLVEMWFMVGLRFSDHAAANLYHLLFAVGTVAAAYSLGRRIGGAAAGTIAALVTASAPIVVWESGAAYIEMAMAFYLVLAVDLVLLYREAPSGRTLALSGLMFGFGLGTKALVLVPLALVILMLMAGRTPFRHLRWLLLGSTLAGCPFYLKTWALTGNPVYPWAYSVFGGRWWSAELSAAYSTEQRSFGLNHTLETPSDDAAGKPRPEWQPPTLTDRLRNTALAPFGLAAMPTIYYNLGDPGVPSHIGFLGFSLFFAGVLVFPKPRAVQFLVVFAGLWIAAWCATMQYVRYIIPILPFLAVVGGFGAAHWLRAMKPAGAACLLGTAAQCALTLLHFGAELPERTAVAFDREARERYIQRSVNISTALEWINANAKSSDGVVLFEDTRGYALNRPYLWGNSLHSTYIPYANFDSGEDMALWFRRHGVRYAVINLQFAHPATTPEGNQRLREAVATGDLMPLLMSWYNPRGQHGELWRRWIGDALQTGSAVLIPEASRRAAAVLEFRLPEEKR
jgi:hypothetical protein